MNLRKEESADKPGSV